MSERHETFGALTDPDGALTLNAEQVRQLCRGVPVQAYCGIGPRPARIQVPPYGRGVHAGHPDATARRRVHLARLRRSLMPATRTPEKPARICPLCSQNLYSYRTAPDPVIHAAVWEHHKASKCINRDEEKD